VVVTGQGSNFQYRLGHQLFRLILIVVFLTFPGKFSVLNFDLSSLLSCPSKFTVLNHSSLLFKIKDGWMVGYLTELFQKCIGYVASYDAGCNCFTWNWSDRGRSGFDLFPVTV